MMDALCTYSAFSPQFQHVEVPVPDPKADEVLLKMEAATINPIDWKIQKGALPPLLPRKLPYIPGTDMAGEVFKVGSSVKKFSRGDKVVSMFSHACSLSISSLNVYVRREFPPVSMNFLKKVPLYGLAHYTTRGAERFYCSRCHSIIPISAYEAHNYSSNVTKTWKYSPLHKIRSPPVSSGYKAFPNEGPKTLLSLFSACPRNIHVANPRKRALIYGVSYKKQKYRLKGTLTDVYNIKDLLMNQYQFPANAIRVLTGPVDG